MQKVNFTLKGIRGDEMRFNLNNIRIPRDTKLDLKPAFSRQVRTATENEKIFFVSLSVSIEGTADMPKPFNLVAKITGVFEADATTDEEKKAFTIEATNVLYPYLRSAVTSLTAAAFTAPLVLPVVNGGIFPEDREENGGYVS